MKRIKNVLILIICLLFVSCGALTTLLIPEEDQQDVAGSEVDDNENTPQNNFYFNGTVYSDSYDQFGHAVNSYTGLIDVDFEFPTTYTGFGAEGQKCVRADLSEQGEFGVLNFYSEHDVINLTSYNSIKFLAKADSNVSIQIGLDADYGAWSENNNGVSSVFWVDLTSEWREYTINLEEFVDWAYTGGTNFLESNFDLSRVTSLFKVDGISNPEVPFYIDNIYYSSDTVTNIPDDPESSYNAYTYQIEWGQLNEDYVNNVVIVDAYGNEVMVAAGSMQLNQVYTTPVTDSYFGTGNALNYVHYGDFFSEGWGGVFFNGIAEYNDLNHVTEFKVAIKGYIPQELTCWELKVEGDNGSNQGLNFMEYEVDSGDPEWRLFIVPASEFNLVEFDAFSGLGLWNPKEGLDISAERDYVACDLIIDVAMYSEGYIPPVILNPYNDYLYQIEWDQLTQDYVNNVYIVDEYGYEVMTAVGSMQLGQVFTTPVNDSFFGVGNGLNYVHDGSNSWGGVFFNGIVSDNDLSGIEEFKIAVKGDIPQELTCWGFRVEGGNESTQELNFLEYEVVSGDPQWRLFVIPASEFDLVDLNAFGGLGIWNPKEGYDLTYESNYVGCDLIIDVAVDGEPVIIDPLPTPGIDFNYIYQVEWDQLTSDYENNVRIVDSYGNEVMYASGAMQLGQVTSYPVTDSYFGSGNALNYMHDGVDSWGGVFLNGVFEFNDLSWASEFKVAIKGDIPAELTCWGLKIEGGNWTNQEVNFLQYEVTSEDSDWRLFSVPASEYYQVELDAFEGIGLWNPKQGFDLYFEGGFVGCDLIVDIAIN